MKRKGAHLVRLSKQARSLLKEPRGLTGGGALVFPGIRLGKPLSENTLNSALRTLGYSRDEHVSHGFRGMVATRLNELGWNPDAIERQLARARNNKARAAYTHKAQHLAERKRMMRKWADYLDELRVARPKVVPIKSAKRA